MKMLVLIAALAAAVPGLSCNRPSEETTPPAAAPTETPAPSTPTKSDPGTKQAWIYFTKNHNKGTGSPYNTECVGIVGTERIGAQMGKPAETSPPKPAVPGTKIIWHIRLDNGGNDDDKCPMSSLTDVNLRFNTDVMGAAAMRKLTATGMTIQGQVSDQAGDIGSIVDHKYRVYIGDDIAGPDPIVVVGCGGCGL